MRKISQVILIAMSMLVMFTVGILAGGDRVTYEVKQANEFSYQYVNYTGSVYRGNYEIRFQEKIVKPERFENVSVTVHGKAVVKNCWKVIKVKDMAGRQES